MLTARYGIATHPHHSRLRHVAIAPEVVRAFLQAWTHIDHQNLEYVPYMRFVIAQSLDEVAGGELGRTLRAIVHDRASGAFTTGVAGVTEDADDFVKFATAFSHLLGPANFDAMQKTYYARFAVKHTDESDSYLRQAYRDLTLHTDGTYVDEPTDWLLMMKIAEHDAAGGESRLLHLDDWQERSDFSDHDLATYPFTYKSPPSKNVSTVVRRRTFFERDGKPCISFIDQFAHPDDIAGACYLHDMSASMERSPAVVALPLPVGDLVVLNNLFWLHGRAAFERNELLHRELLRQRGRFS